MTQGKKILIGIYRGKYRKDSMKKIKLTEKGRHVGAYVLCALLAAGLAVAGACYAQEKQSREVLEQQRQDDLRRSCYDLQEDLQDMETALSKLTAAGSKKQSTLLLGDVWKLSGSAAATLSLLPAAHGEVYRLNQFLLRAGDYAHGLMEGLLSGKALTNQDTQQLSSLRTQCAEEGQRVQTLLDTGTYPQGALEEDGYYSEEEREDLPDYPTLIYDGPFSESSENRDPKGLEAGRISEEQARSRAKELFSEGELQYSGYVSAPMATYDYTLTTENMGEVTLSMTERGGKLLCFMGEPTGQNQDAPTEEESGRLHRVAAGYLYKLGFADMEPSYAQYYAGVVVLNYAPRQAGVILYNDLVKVYVDRETEQVCGLDARNYYANHQERTIEAPTLTEMDARERLREGLQVEKVTLALIPLTSEREVLCYECKCLLGEDFYIVYLNAQTGEEEQIFQVIDSENGDLVV